MSHHNENINRLRSNEYKFIIYISDITYMIIKLNAKTFTIDA